MCAKKRSIATVGKEKSNVELVQELIAISGIEDTKKIFQGIFHYAYFVQKEDSIATRGSPTVAIVPERVKK